jgi:diaminopimelate epimerase
LSARAELVEGAGNRFVLVDAWDEEPAHDHAALARALCAGGERADGLLVLRRARGRGADCAMVVHNADGTRPEACGNGLRCLAALARELGRVERDALAVETDAGLRRVQLVRDAGEVVGARAEMGPARILALELALEMPGGGRAVVAQVELGNPHLVLAVEDERVAPVATLGPFLEHHPRLPRGANVGFLALREGALRLRVWERGVGETLACGSGATAAALVARARGACELPATVSMRGGVLLVGLDARGEPWLEGPVRRLGALALDGALGARPR